MNCRGHETRQRIVRDYEVQPEAHIKLLANQQKLFLLYLIFL